MNPYGGRRIRKKKRTHVVICSLVGLKNQPAIGNFPFNRGHRSRKLRRVITANPEQDGARRVGCNHDPVVFVVVIVERGGESPVHLNDGVPINPPLGSPSIGVTVREHLVCPISRPPRGRGTGTDHTAPTLVSTDRRLSSNGGQGSSLADNTADGLPVKARRGGFVQHD